MTLPKEKNNAVLVQSILLEQQRTAISIPRLNLYTWCKFAGSPS